MELSTNPRQYQYRGGGLTKPHLVGYYSLDGDRQYRDDYSQLKYIQYSQTIPRNVTMDLNHNMHSRRKRLLSTEKLRGLLCYLKLHRNVIDVFSKTPVTMDQVPFVCCRGTLRTMGKQPYENNEPIRVSVCLANGVIYMHPLETPEMRTKEDMTEREQIMCSWGYKFEQYMLSDDPQSDPCCFPPVDENSEFNCIYKSTLGKHNLLYGAEMDGFLVENRSKEIYNNWMINSDKQDHDTVVNYLKEHRQVELKTSRLLEEPRHFTTFRKYKTLTWWLQSYFAGNDSVICGFRDDDGIVKEINSFKTFDLPQQALGWNEDVCLNFCEEFLSFVKRALINILKQQGHGVGKDINVKLYPPVSIILYGRPRSPVVVDNPWPDENVTIIDDWFFEMLSKS